MPFQKGHKLSKGRPKGVLNNPDIASLKVLLSDAFLRNRSAAIAKIDSMFMNADLADFKWLCQIKASLEPREVSMEHSGTVEGTKININIIKNETGGLPNNATPIRSAEVSH